MMYVPLKETMRRNRKTQYRKPRLRDRLGFLCVRRLRKGEGRGEGHSLEWFAGLAAENGKKVKNIMGNLGMQSLDSPKRLDYNIRKLLTLSV